ncbi:alpha/beta hydrolase [Pseudomonas fulva]|uniref:alpha/beta hydrolase n=1 Tax=Pseudomonas putida group TaxID=136845 RepID=UPI0015F4A1D3|nr:MULTISPECIES: alpha/beta hydrolase [Pseudomonas putida group]MBA5709458.1 alpha/beta hydrolase [Pseudomonas fulva]MBF8728515.1 alpha/beta hydrolase [Pseudomonas putida]
MSLNPDIAAYLQLVEAGRAEGKTLAMHAASPELAREVFDQSSLLMSAGGDDLEHIEELEISARDGALLPARLYSAHGIDRDRLQPGVLYFHGGGYVVGSLDSHDALCRTLAALSGCVVLSVAYRLAPQWRFPTAAQDALDAWQWLQDQGPGIGIDAGRLAVAGDSVGGSLATVVANHAAMAPRLQVMIYPVTDASRWHDSVQRYATGHLLEADTLEWFYQHYQRSVEDRSDPRFSPLLETAERLRVPALLVVAECDPLFDEGRAYAAHLRAAGVEVEERIYEGMVHDFMRMDALVDEAQEALEVIAEALQRRL